MVLRTHEKGTQDGASLGDKGDGRASVGLCIPDLRGEGLEETSWLDVAQQAGTNEGIGEDYQDALLRHHECDSAESGQRGCGKPKHKNSENQELFLRLQEQGKIQERHLLLSRRT